MGASQREGPSISGRRKTITWQVLALAAVASVVLQAAATVISVVTSAAEFRLAGALASGGFVMFRGLVAWGVVNRARWALWVGGVIAAVTLVVPVLLAVRVEAGATVVEASTALTAALAWTLAGINALFLGGIVFLRFGDHIAPAVERLLRAARLRS